MAFGIPWRGMERTAFKISSMSKIVSSMWSGCHQNPVLMIFLCCMSSADAVNFVRKRLKEHGDVQVVTAWSLYLRGIHSPSCCSKFRFMCSSMYWFPMLCSLYSAQQKKLDRKLWSVANSLPLSTISRFNLQPACSLKCKCNMIMHVWFEMLEGNNKFYTLAEPGRSRQC